MESRPVLSDLLQARFFVFAEGLIRLPFGFLYLKNDIEDYDWVQDRMVKYRRNDNDGLDRF